MFLGKLNKHSDIIWQWYMNERDNGQYPSNRVMYSLKWYVKHYPLAEYDYHGDWRGHLEYCSDRMNGGRAKAILRLIKQDKLAMEAK